MTLAVLALEHVEAHVARLLAARRGKLLDELDRFALGRRSDLEIGDGVFRRSRRGRRLRSRGCSGHHDRSCDQHCRTNLHRDPPK